MLFNSLEFLIFFPLVTALYFLLPHRYRWLHLLIASCAFYMFFIPVYIVILLGTIVIDYYAGILIEDTLDPIKRKRWLTLSIIANVGVLCVFKYYNFFTDNVNALFGYNVGEGIPYLDMILPIGLSFHTFQAMSYTIEVHRGNQKAERHMGIYALYVMFYPQLVAGPIERPQNMLHQFHEKHEFDYSKAVSGVKLMCWGMFKKVVIADRLAVMVDEVYNHPGAYEGYPVWMATYLFSIQVFCDFSGYSDIALGSARVMGFDLMKNFNRPYWATSIAEFWRKWHISLNTWFVDYVYTPIVVNKRNWEKWAVVYAILITFSLSGLWHGAKWTFVIWGTLHGIALSYDFLSKKMRKKWSKAIPSTIYKPLSLFLTFNFVSFTYIFFRANTVEDAFHLIASLGKLHLSQLSLHPFGMTIGAMELIVAFVFIIVMEVIHSLQVQYGENLPFIAKAPSVVRWSLYCAAGITIVLFGVMQKQSFIYFQF